MSEVCLPLSAECLAHQHRDCGHYPLALGKSTWCIYVHCCCCVNWTCDQLPPHPDKHRHLHVVAFPVVLITIKPLPFLPCFLQVFLFSDSQIQVLSHIYNYFLFSYFSSYCFSPVISCLVLASTCSLNGLSFLTEHLSGIQKSSHVWQGHLQTYSFLNLC